MGDSIWFIDHATFNSEVQFEVGRKVFHQFLLKWEKSKYPKLQKYTMWLTFNIKIRVSFFHFVVLKIWLIFSKKINQNFHQKKQKLTPKIPSFRSKNQPKHWSGCKSQLSMTSKFGREWTSTHQCTNVDGWCTDRILFSIHVPSHVDFFSLPFLSPDLSFFCNFIFSPPPTHFYF
jgi:hypothetical protein